MSSVLTEQKLLSVRDLQTARAALEKAQTKVTLLTTALAKQEKKQSKKAFFAKMKQKYAFGGFRKMFNNDIYPSIDCWEACVQITDHLTENYNGNLFFDVKKTSDNIPTEKAKITEHIMTELCAKLIALRKEYLDVNLKN